MKNLIISIIVSAILAGPEYDTAQAQSATGLTLSPIGYENGRFELRINGPPKRVYRVDASVDLKQWSVLSTNVTGETLLVTDAAAAGFRYRFYRASANPEAHGPGQSILALQGLSTTSLVAGKTTGFRFFTDELTYAAANRVEATILRPDGSRLVSSWLRSEIVQIPASSRGQSLLVRVAGRDIPWVGGYGFQASILDARNAVLATYSIDQARLLPTKDLRFIVTFLYKQNNPGAYFPTIGWVDDVQRSMLRLGAMFPVRDGVQGGLNGDLSNGIRYTIGDRCDGYVDGYYDCVYQQTRAINATSGDHIDVSVEFRPGFYLPDSNPPGDPNPGGNANRPPPPYSDLPRASCVAGRYFEPAIGAYVEMTAPCFAQEIGHNLGLEPASSPHSDPGDPIHSKDPLIADPDAYDFLNNRPYSMVEDTMSNYYPDGAWSGADKVMFNAFDWEYLRQRIVTLPSTGPTAPVHFTTDVAPTVAGVGNNVYLFAKRLDGRIFYNRAQLGQGGVGWSEMEGDGRTDTAPAAGAVGTHVFVAVKGLNGNIYLNQADLGQSFGQWFPMNFTTDVPPAVTGVGNSVLVFAKGLDRRVYLNQAVLGQGFSGWFEVQGNGLTDTAPSAGAVGTHVFVAVKGLNGTVYLNQADFGQAFNSFWSPAGFTTDVAQAVTGVGNNVYIFAKHLDGRIFYNRAQLGQGLLGWAEVQGDGRTDTAPGAGAVGTHVFVAAKGLDDRFFLNQADLGQPFGQWFP